MNGAVTDTTPAAWRVPGADIPVDLVTVRRAIVRTADTAADLVEGIEDLRAPVPGSDWSAAEAATHLILVLRAFAAGMEGRLDAWGTPQGEAIVQALADIGDPLNAASMARQLREAAQTFDHAAVSRPPDHVFATPWYEIDKTNLVGTMTCLVLGEVVLHGHDIATAVGRAWPIDPEDSRRIISGVFPVKALALVNPDTAGDVRATYELHVDGGPDFVVRFHDGTVTVEPGGSCAVDCHLGGDPGAILFLGYGRADPHDLFAQGRLRAWGDDPSLGLTFSTLLKKP
jgi:hypothetical protein